ARAPSRLPPSGPAVSPLRHPDPLARPGRREPHRLLVPGLPEPVARRRRPARTVVARVTLRAPRLYDALRRFCLGAFRRLAQEVEGGADVPFAFEEHGGRGRPSFYEYRPLVRGFVEARASRLGGGEDAAIALEELAREPEATGLLPPGFGREPDRVCVLELERDLRRGTAEAPDAPGEIADAVTALRLATAAPVAAGPVLFERLDWRPYGVRPVLPIAATQPPGEPTRLDAVRAGRVRELLERLASVEDDPDLGEALDRWELSLFQSEP